LNRKENIGKMFFNAKQRDFSAENSFGAHRTGYAIKTAKNSIFGIAIDLVLILVLWNVERWLKWKT
jgi:hypothetical protein